MTWFQSLRAYAPRARRSAAWCTSLLLVACALAACANEKTGTIVGPGLTAVPNPAVLAASDAAPVTARALPALTAAPGSPISAAFVDLDTTGYVVSGASCELVVVAVVKGTASALGTNLVVGDVLRAGAVTPFTLRGDGTVVVAKVSSSPPCTPASLAVARAAEAPALTFAKGAMQAHLDVQGGAAYVGRLSGTASVAPHNHEGAWEILCAYEASGTFGLEPGGPLPATAPSAATDSGASPALVSQHLGPRGIVMVPAGRAHQWTPDLGSRLVAIQMYDPPGPEERFKRLAAVYAATLDAGATR